MTYDKELINNHDFLLSMIEEAPYGIIAIDLMGNITIANAQSLEQLGLEYSIDELTGMKILEVIDEIDELKTKVDHCLTKKRKQFDIEEVFYNGKYLTFRGRKIHNGMIVTIADISSIKEAKHAALNSLLEGQEQERKRLAREIHDGIGPILSTLKMNLANIEGDVETISHELGDKFRKSYEMIDEAANDLRSISHNLMPRVLSDFGLIEALETLCEKIDETKGIEVSFINSGWHERLDEVTELALYRIGQELINNTLKYAQAKKITLQVIRRDLNIQLMYEDDGKGFLPELVSKGIGLMNIENRAKALAGEVIIDSHPGRGMTATVEIPLN
ncbi:PAS domain-containing sensor histidine kinase [Reichenbachiella sp. MALMAid0571]|uniref:PAS domain-containing sensor histidine kinase n=1 Tax=Reichenbachiella sp. MALMAid0571 TaxID=3143939 RepID=UPI0032DF5AE4